MANRTVLCFALVALALCSAHADKGLSASGSLDLSLSKAEATAVAAEATAAAADSGVAVLSVPQVSVGLSVKKEQVPLLTVSDAPCKKICAPKCTITLEKHCLTVDVPKKHCAIEKKTISKQFCEKKCKPSLKLDLPETKLPSLAQQNPNPSAPPAALAANPSAVPATLQAESQPKLHLSKSAALSASLDDASASVDASALLDVNGRRLQTLPKADLDMECHDVCVTVPFVMPEVKCTETTVQVEKCTKVPSKMCKEECICLPQKSLSLALPKKPSLSVSVDASASAVSVDASASSSKRDLKNIKIVLPEWFPKLATHKFGNISAPGLSAVAKQKFANISAPALSTIAKKKLASFSVPTLPNNTVATINISDSKHISISKPDGKN
ncbi:hypothetical protein OEZ85_006531 [Tetradesmus obliquus]|uniref:Pherophorin domain-containing protein n=1 Tax=Tetradesmus obliquus TaxID=3088 RepID=A0ABY8TUV4_TETOB|nr:hypothetical protein OEZ85_006531 [Tetradesmus obliquus]